LKKSLRTASTPTTVAATIERAARHLHDARLVYGHGTFDAWQEATWITSHVLGVPFAAINERAAEALPTRTAGRIERLVAQRIATRMPLAYLLHEAWLGELRFYVDERVIVPRSFIAEILRGRIASWLARPRQVRRILDLCTGSGCLAILAAKVFPHATVDAIDLSKPALQVARKNVRLHALGERIRLIESDLFAAVAVERYDLIISNPPYVNSASMRRLPVEYRHEPNMALAGGTDGLELTLRILDQAAAHLSLTGKLLVEIGHNRKALERRRPKLPFQWMTASAGDDFVFLLDRHALDA
jgi:ribosomal protein L3 glutamine methyltransferase